jgi:RimJ/RimL family protein N-acetyltransferase
MARLVIARSQGQTSREDWIAMPDLETSRIRLRDATGDDLSQLITVMTGNTAFLQMTEGSAGEAGIYDLARLQRDWTIAQMMPGRHVLGGYLKESGEPVAYVDYMDENDDGLPWIGTLIIHVRHQRQGLGSEVFHTLTQHGQATHGWTSLRAGVLQSNAPALAFVSHLGFHPVGETEQTSPDGKTAAIIFERSLDSL